MDYDYELRELVMNEIPDPADINSIDLSEVEFPHLSYLATGEGIENINQSYFPLSIPISVKTKQKEIFRNDLSDFLRPEGAKLDHILDIEFFEMYDAVEKLIESYEQSGANLLKYIEIMNFKHRVFRDVQSIMPEEKGLLKAYKSLKTNWAEMDKISPEELELMDSLVNGMVSKEDFSAFVDVEKIHLQLAFVNYEGENVVFPVYVGIGNNMPFTRQLQDKFYGDNRFYRRDEIRGLGQHYEYKLGKGWRNCLDFPDPFGNIMELMENSHHSMTDLRDLINKSQKDYPSYFQDVHDITKRALEYKKKTGKEVDTFLHWRLQLDPDIRLRAAASVAYHYIDSIIL